MKIKRKNVKPSARTEAIIGMKVRKKTVRPKRRSIEAIENQRVRVRVEIGTIQGIRTGTSKAIGVKELQRREPMTSLMILRWRRIILAIVRLRLAWGCSGGLGVRRLLGQETLELGSRLSGLRWILVRRFK